MIGGVSRVALYVEDQERAKRFWTDVMGFELLLDAPYGPDTRWIEVQPPDKSVVLVLTARREGWPSMAGSLAHVIFTCDDIQATHRELTERGVEFTAAPTKEFWGWSAIFADPDGTLYNLGQRDASPTSSA